MLSFTATGTPASGPSIPAAPHAVPASAASKWTKASSPGLRASIPAITSAASSGRERVPRLTSRLIDAALRAPARSASLTADHLRHDEVPERETGRSLLDDVGGKRFRSFVFPEARGRDLRRRDVVRGGDVTDLVDIVENPRQLVRH